MWVQQSCLTFRTFGPLSRFDHHRGDGPDRLPVDDPERAVYYCAWSSHLSEAFASCLVEVFGDRGVVSYGNYMAAFPEVTRSLTLLDLRDSGAMRAGTVAAIAKCDHSTSQPWSKFFYEEEMSYGSVDGLLYRNAHNDGPAVLLYERAQDALAIDREHILRLDHPDADFQYLIQSAIQENNLMLGTSS